eukprot:939727-Rhodomonas_salina.6
METEPLLLSLQCRHAIRRCRTWSPQQHMLFCSNALDAIGALPTRLAVRCFCPSPTLLQANLSSLTATIAIARVLSRAQCRPSFNFGRPGCCRFNRCCL